jgi:polyisoprenoid-binding protein YceI
MRDTYLEVGRGPAFTQARLEEICIERTEGRTELHGTLSLHGVRRAISGEADMERQRDGGIRVRADFPVSLADFGIQPPRYLGLGVQDAVHVKVTFAAIP